MPIYSYRCEACEHAQDALQKISDPPLVVCPSCGESAFRKQVTAAGFQLKGSGWYVTDFRNSQAAKAGAKGKTEKESTASDAASNSASGGDKATSGSESGGDSGSKEKASSPASSDAPPTSSVKGSSKPPSSSTPATTASK